MTPQDLQLLIDKLETKLARQHAALAATIAEHEHATQLKTPFTIQEQLQAKRLRQTNAVLATEGYLKVLKSTTRGKTATK